MLNTLSARVAVSKKYATYVRWSDEMCQHLTYDLGDTVGELAGKRIGVDSTKQRFAKQQSPNRS